MPLTLDSSLPRYALLLFSCTREHPQREKEGGNAAKIQPLFETYRFEVARRGKSFASLVQTVAAAESPIGSAHLSVRLLTYRMHFQCCCFPISISVV